MNNVIAGSSKATAFLGKNYYVVAYSGEICHSGLAHVDYVLRDITSEEYQILRSTCEGLREFQVLFPNQAPTIVLGHTDDPFLIEHEVEIKYINNPNKIYHKDI